MINLTPAARTFMARAAARERSIATVRDVQVAQMRQLYWLTGRGRNTLYLNGGQLRRPGGNIEQAINSHEFYARNIPVATYPAIRTFVERMIKGERNVLWPGRCYRFAQSSGTSDGRSKFIPVTPDSLSHNHYPGATASVAFYLTDNPASRMFAGKGFILGGSFDNTYTGPRTPRTRIGDLSANLIDAINPIVNLFRVPSKETALMADWAEKLPALVAQSIHADITNISGVPSWFMTVLRRVIETAGADNIHQVWPNLEVFFHGGIAMGPYRDAYASLTDPSHPMHYRETYNASEGFFAAQDTPEPGPMRLLLNAGVFYEFVALDDYTLVDEGKRIFPVAHPAWGLEEGRTYALLITAPNGLWRYAIGDTVTVHSVAPLRITIAGRTRHYINAFGEEVMVHNTDRAIAEACRRTRAAVENYTVAPVFAPAGLQNAAKGHHQWLIEWLTPPADIEKFADILDQALQNENSDYQAKRSGSIFLSRLTITTAQPGLFDRWLALTGKLGGQRKVPRLSTDRTNMDRLLALNETTHNK